MTRSPKKFRAALASAVLAAGLVIAVGIPSLAQQPPTEDEILTALRPQPRTRGLTKTPKEIADQQFIDQVRSRPRALTLDERTKIADIVKEKPQIDLEVNFEFNSAAIGPDAVPVLTRLGAALSKDEMKGGTFMLGGHTDAKGSAAYNQVLSERRAAAVKRFLVTRFGLAPESLVTAGYGKEQLKNTADPFAAANRRVQIVNLETKVSAGR